MTDSERYAMARMLKSIDEICPPESVDHYGFGAASKALSNEWRAIARAAANLARKELTDD